MLSCAIEKDHAPQQKSVQPSSSWGKRVCTTLSTLEKNLQPTKRQSCKWAIKRKLSRPSTTSVIMEPDLFLLRVRETTSSPSWIGRRPGRHLHLFQKSLLPHGTVCKYNREQHCAAAAVICIMTPFLNLQLQLQHYWL